MSDEQRRPRDPADGFREAVRSISGVLGALKDSLEATFEELREKGEFTPDRAREAASATFRKAQDAVDDVRDRLDFVTRREFDQLRMEVYELRARMDAFEGGSAAARAAGGAAGTRAGPGSSAAGATAAPDSSAAGATGGPGSTATGAAPPGASAATDPADAAVADADAERNHDDGPPPPQEPKFRLDVE